MEPPAHVGSGGRGECTLPRPCDLSGRGSTQNAISSESRLTVQPLPPVTGPTEALSAGSGETTQLTSPWRGRCESHPARRAGPPGLVIAVGRWSEVDCEPALPGFGKSGGPFHAPSCP